ncbi:MAG: 2'-deoxycytidine 5'-triphosphate deaminase, partial [Patescibacteria group bacterium]
MTTSGALPSQFIQQISRLGQITLGRKPVPEEQIKPASYDLTLGERAWCVKATFLPIVGETIAGVIDRYQLYSFTMDKPTVLTVGSTYIIELQEHFALDAEISALVSPKSSSGRINLWVRTLVDSYPRFDRIPRGYKGKVYALISPKSWPVRIRPGDSVTQVRFFRGTNGQLSSFELALLNKEVGLTYDQEGNLLNDSESIVDDGIMLTADLDRDISAYQAKHTMEVLDLQKVGGHSSEDFFYPINGNKHRELILKEGEFYILPSFE